MSWGRSILSLARANCRRGGLLTSLNRPWFHIPVFLRKNENYRGKLLSYGCIFCSLWWNLLLYGVRLRKLTISWKNCGHRYYLKLSCLEENHFCFHGQDNQMVAYEQFVFHYILMEVPVTSGDWKTVFRSLNYLLVFSIMSI